MHSEDGNDIVVHSRRTTILEYIGYGIAVAIMAWILLH
jgi:hypothetical protein